MDKYVEINGQIYRNRWIDIQKQMDRCTYRNRQ